jgi:hypothetical protein
MQGDSPMLDIWAMSLVWAREGRGAVGCLNSRINDAVVEAVDCE